MSAKIRLSRVGKGAKKRPFFRIVVIDSHKSRDGKVIEILGIYDPTIKPLLVKMKRERFDYWVSKGAEVSETVKRLAKKIK